MKTCPVCAEALQDGAVKCRFCGADLASSEGKPPALSPYLLPVLAIAALAVVVVAVGVIAGVMSRRSAAGEAPDDAERAAARLSREPYSFGVRWGAPPQTVSMQLMGRGLSFTGHDEDGDQIYSGAVDGTQALVIAMFARGGLAKVIVAFNTPADPQAAFDAAVKRLTSRYGPPQAAPATPSAGGKALARWAPRPDDTGDTRVWTTVTDTSDVVIHYESGGWESEAARRKQEGPKGGADETPRGTAGPGRGMD